MPVTPQRLLRDKRRWRGDPLRITAHLREIMLSAGQEGSALFFILSFSRLKKVRLGSIQPSIDVILASVKRQRINEHQIYCNITSVRIE